MNEITIKKKESDRTTRNFVFFIANKSRQFDVEKKSALPSSFVWLCDFSNDAGSSPFSLTLFHFYSLLCSTQNRQSHKQTHSYTTREFNLNKNKNSTRANRIAFIFPIFPLLCICSVRESESSIQSISMKASNPHGLQTTPCGILIENTVHFDGTSKRARKKRIRIEKKCVH